MRLIIGLVLALAALAGGYYGYNRFIAPASAASAKAPEAELARLEKLASAKPSAPLAAEADYAALSEALGGLAQVTFGAVETEGSGAVARDVFIASKDDAEIGVKIGELRLYGANADAMSQYAAGQVDDRGALVAKRIEAKAVEWVGFDKLFGGMMDGYAGAVESAFDSAAPDDSEDAGSLSSPAPDFSIDISRADWRVGRLVVDGLRLHPWTAPPPAAEEPAVGADAASWREMTRAFMTMAAAARVTSLDAFLAEGVVSGMDYAQSTGRTSLTVSIPMLAARGISRGDQDFMAMRDVKTDMRIEMPRAEYVTDKNGEPVEQTVEGPPIIMEMSSGADLYAVEGVKFARLYEYVAAGEAPPMSETDLISLGVWRVKGERQAFGDAPFYSVRDTVMDLSRFHWLIPTELRFSSQGIVYDVAGLLTWVRNSDAAGGTAAGDQSAQSLEQFDGVIEALDKVGLGEIRADFDMTASYAPATGETGGAFSIDAADIANLVHDSEGILPDYARLRALAPPEGEKMSLEALLPALLNETKIRKYDLTITDRGGIAKSFAAAVEMAKLAPAEDAGAAMLRNADPADLRVSTAAMMRLSGSRAAASFPPAADYSAALAAFLEKGGSLSIRINPPRPLAITEVQATLALAQTDPQAFVDTLGLSVTHKPARK